MANKKLTELDEITTIPDDSLLMVVIDPSTTPVSKKITWLSITDSVFVVTDLAVTSEVTDFPASAKNRWYKITSEGWIGGAAGDGIYVNIGDLLFCNTATSAGTYAAVWQNWNLYRHEIAQPNAYRYLELASNTIAPSGVDNAIYVLNDVLYKIQGGVHTAI